jgi:AcrR family transcriptional regulator
VTGRDILPAGGAAVGVKERRERERQATRQLILDAARELLVEGGSDALTMRALAERIEYSATAIYVHFADKEALLTELSVCDFHAFTAHLAGQLPPDAPPLDRLRFLGRAYLDFAVQHPTTYRHLFLTDREVSEEAQSRKPPEDAYDVLLATVRACLASGALHPGWSDRPHHVAQAMWGSLHGLASLHLTMPKRTHLPLVPLAEQAEVTMDTLVVGFQRAPGGG